MQDDPLEQARQQAEKAEASIRAAALLRIARVEAHGDHSRARQTLLEGLDAVQKLIEPLRQYLFNEARIVAAAATPELLSAIPAAVHEGIPRFPHIESVHIIQTMLVYGHVDAAFDYLIHQEDPDFSLPLRWRRASPPRSAKPGNGSSAHTAPQPCP